MKLPTGEVSPRHICRALTEEILPCLGINKENVAEQHSNGLSSLDGVGHV